MDTYMPTKMGKDFKEHLHQTVLHVYNTCNEFSCFSLFVYDKRGHDIKAQEEGIDNFWCSELEAKGP